MESMRRMGDGPSEGDLFHAAGPELPGPLQGLGVRRRRQRGQGNQNRREHEQERAQTGATTKLHECVFLFGARSGFRTVLHDDFEDANTTPRPPLSQLCAILPLTRLVSNRKAEMLPRLLHNLSRRSASGRGTPWRPAGSARYGMPSPYRATSE